MSRPVFPFHADDISSLARSLVKQWADVSTPPGHLQMLNMLARAAGYQNFQHFRESAEAVVSPPDAAAPDASAPPLTGPRLVAGKMVAPANTQRLLRHFDEQGRLLRWPGKFSEQLPVLWTVWARLPARQDMTEREVNDYIRQGEAFGDHVLLRRELVNYRLLERTPDGARYRRLEQAPPADVRELMQLCRQRAAA
ncbi:DUF2087 domain-containing protein [Chitinimonas viridis]|uniref:DUF2087 domain-containing protein n=1 Tax=Chitinimonas viridis TaxID=664880 RepID=A0ABT8B0U3_9NEIS|nr:DUF2087 domain-containing protein [Chitinimonas viridis]MDN3575674.1 DUF2087 domain-containing protein [Chitinimonas viridis]